MAWVFNYCVICHYRNDNNKLVHKPVHWIPADKGIAENLTGLMRG